jgi:hypothetical protein
VSLVVVPGAVCLGRPEAVALRSYVLNGGGLLSAGLLGVCGAPDRERAASRWLEELVGAEHVEPLRVAPGPASVAFRDGSPLAAGLEALSLVPPRRGRLVAVAPGLHPYWSDSQLQPLDRTLPQGYQSAALTASLGKGRVAWLGFGLEPASSEPESTLVRRLVGNAASWAAGLPVVSLAPWPGPHRSAVLLRANLAGHPRNAAFVTRMLLDARTRGAFVVSDDSLEDLAALEPSLARAGEVVLVAHSQAVSRTSSQLQAAAERLNAWRVLGAWPSGLLTRDASAEQAALASAIAGLDFYLSEGASGRGRPMVWRATRRWGPWQRRSDVVGFGRLGDDDLGLSPLGLAGLPPQWLRRRLLADFEVSAALGGLHVLSFHTQGLGSPDRVETLANLAAEFVARGAWVAGPAELAAWSRARAGLEMIADATTAGRLRVKLRTSSAPPVEPVAVDVHPPPGTHAVVEPGSADCQASGPVSGGAERLLVHVGPEARDYRCDVRFVP